MSGEEQRWVLVARILRARGNKGEVAAELLTDFPERLTRLRQVFVRGGVNAGMEPRATALQSCWLSQNHKGQAVFHFAGVSSISEAEKLRGCEILLPIEQRISLPAGSYFVSDLIGCSVFEIPATSPTVSSSPCSMSEAPALLGSVRDVQFPGDQASGTPILEVETATGEVLIPMAVDICTRIAPAERRIEVTLPDGLRDLNENKK